MKWSALSHPNVLPVWGVMVKGDELDMVSEFMVNGNITEYIKKRPEANPFKLVRPHFQHLL